MFGLACFLLPVSFKCVLAQSRAKNNGARVAGVLAYARLNRLPQPVALKDEYR